ncbi:unnamed protein product [Menidia menidia]|uniref:(Atlantic silverside) hypothetical protein n=1 Tax=Menidia menidia TaxID=238744 RepID=A0A8S4B819_9TELE|nr:unnamed protein product [Menidia menidia]
MQNKLKRNKVFDRKLTLSKSSSLTSGVNVHSESSCSYVEIKQERGPTAEKEDGISKEGLKIAPIFLRQNRRSSHEGQRAEDAPESGLGARNDRLLEKSPKAREVRETKGCVVNTVRGQLSSDVHRCLEEIQTLNSAFPVQTVFRALQKKATEALEENGSKEPNVEEVLWTEKYVPKHSSEVIGNAGSVTKLLSWLRQWKLRADSDERRKMEEQKGQEKAHGKNWKLTFYSCTFHPEADSSCTGSWDCGDFQGEAGSGNEGKQPLCNAMLITGPSGVGKTASVYACAQELGFKVFEVNSSSQRSGRHVLSQLREATQSHLVETSGKYPLKPAYFSNYAASSCRLKAEALPGKTGCLKNGTTTSKKRPALNTSSSGRKIKAKPATVTLAHYFKRREVADHPHFGVMKPGGRGLDGSLTNCDQTATRSKRMATSLILFEEVDVIFEDDVGFLAAIKAFMTTTRRPVILTTNGKHTTHTMDSTNKKKNLRTSCNMKLMSSSDPFFKERFDCSMEEIIFKTPSAIQRELQVFVSALHSQDCFKVALSVLKANVCSYLQLVCLAEKAQLEFEDVSSLFTLSRGDVRRCLLQLQLWVCNLEAPEGESSDTQPPSHPTTCSALMLGFSNGTLTLSSLSMILLQYGSWSETETGLRRSLNLLAVSWRRDVPLLYSNLELLLTSSFMDKGTPSQHLNRIPHSRPQSEPQSTITDSPVQRLSRKVCVKYRKPVGSGHQLSRKKSIPTSSSDLSSREETYRSDDGVTDCLDALKDFYDVMSYIDASLSGSRTLVSGSCVPETFVWTGAAIKDGLVDEVNEEDPTSTIQDNILDMKATVEGLGCRLSWQRMYELWTVSHRGTLELKHTSYASCKRQRLSFTFQPLCSTREAKRRFRLSRMLQSSEPYSLRGDRRAVSVDYLPFLRSIWRFFNARKQKGELARCLMDLNDTHFSLSKSAMELLEEDFP